MSIIGPRHEYETRIIKALGLPNTTYNLTITMEAGGLARGSCEFYIFDEELASLETAITFKLDKESKERLLRKLDGD